MAEAANDNAHIKLGSTTTEYTNILPGCLSRSLSLRYAYNLLSPSILLLLSLPACSLYLSRKPHTVPIASSVSASLCPSLSLINTGTPYSLSLFSTPFSLLPLPITHTAQKPLHAGDFISLATSSVLQRKHLRRFICLSCCPLAFLSSLFFPSFFSLSPHYSLAFFILHFAVMFVIYYSGKKLNFLFLLRFLAALFSQDTYQQHTHCYYPLPLCRLVPKIYCVVAEFNYKDDNTKRRRAKRDKATARERDDARRSQTQPDKCSRQY